MRIRPLAVLLAAVVVLAAPGAASAATLDSVLPATPVTGAVVTVRGTAVAGSGVQVQLRQRGVWVDSGQPSTAGADGSWSSQVRLVTGGAMRAVVTEPGATELVVTTELDVAVRPRVVRLAAPRSGGLPFVAATASWRVVPSSWGTGQRVRVSLTLDGRQVGSLRARVERGGLVHVSLPMRGVGRHGAVLELPRRPGLAPVRGGAVRATTSAPAVGTGAPSAVVRALRSGLAWRGFHVPRSGGYDSRMGDAVIAFHKAYGRARTSSFSASDWRRLTRSAVAVRTRESGLVVEIDKDRQLLMHVVRGRAVRIVHVSTGATGNTPAGRHSVLWKGDWVPSLYGSLLYKSMAFRGAYAIHGYPSVPTQPASHGCVRVPMWIAASLYAATPVGTPVVVYERGRGVRPSLGRSSDRPELDGIDVRRWVDEGVAAPTAA